MAVGRTGRRGAWQSQIKSGCRTTQSLRPDQLAGTGLQPHRSICAYRCRRFTTSQPPINSGFVDRLIGISGTNVAHQPGCQPAQFIGLTMSHSTRWSRPPLRQGFTPTHWVQEFSSFPTTSEPVKDRAPEFLAPHAALRHRHRRRGFSLDNSSGQNYASDTGPGQQRKTTAAAPSIDILSRPVSGDPDPDFIACPDAESTLSDWSDNWLAYTPFDAVVLSAADFGGDARTTGGHR